MAADRDQHRQATGACSELIATFATLKMRPPPPVDVSFTFKTTARVVRRHFVYFMCLRLLGPKYAPDVGRRRHRAASYFLFADESDFFTIRLDGKN
jgi:hypothetical protein